jgi:hypothetical protein
LVTKRRTKYSPPPPPPPAADKKIQTAGLGILMILLTNYQPEIKQLIHKCSEHVSNKLNNTPTVSKKSYIDNKILDLVMKNPYSFASSIPDSNEEQHTFLYKIILRLRHKDSKTNKK